MTATTAIYGETNPSPQDLGKMPIRRYGSVVEIRKEKEQYYRELHANGWNGVMERIKKSNIQNYSIFIHEIEGKKYLFSYFEYIGNDFDGDMAKIASDKETRRWWKETDPCQKPLTATPDGSNWSVMEPVFLLE